MLVFFRCIVALCCATVIHDICIAASIEVGFDRNEYVVSDSADTFVVNVVIDGDDVEDLFSFGLEFLVDDSLATVDQIAVVPELDFFGLSDSAFEQIESGSISVKGNVDLRSVPEIPYVGSQLIQFTLNNKIALPGTYDLRLERFETLGVTEQIFLDGDGRVLDSEIGFGTARVRVVPEPTLRCYVLPALLSLFYVLRAHRR